MPGTIQVTVLEFKGLSSSSKPSARSLKVSMGKRQYQTWDKGDFSFPITKIRENLVVALLDAGGNEIAHQDIQTMQIIENVSWDEVFSINGAGHVHLKLQFILSEEDRNRVRIMRESALKKKLETNPNIKLRVSEAIGSDSAEALRNSEQVSDVVSTKVEAFQASSSSAPSTSSAVMLSSLERGSDPDCEIPNAKDGSRGSPSYTDHKNEIKTKSSGLQSAADERTETKQLADVRSETEEGPSSKLSESSVSDEKDKVAPKLQENYPSRESKDQGPLEKTPSNVRKMISAFENSKLQKMPLVDFNEDTKTLKKASSVPSQLNRLRKGGLLEDQELKSDNSLTYLKDHFADAVGERDVNEPQKPKTPLVDSTRQYTSERATCSGRMPEEEQTRAPQPYEFMPEEEQTRAPQPYEFPSELLDSTESSSAEGSGRGGRGTGLKSSTMDIASNTKPKSLEYYKEECYSGQCSGMWIFPENTRRLCITTAGKQVMKIVGHQRSVKKISSESKDVVDKSVMHEKEFKNDKNKKRNVDQPESGSGSSPGDSSNGLVGQIIKIAAIVGFGVLVLLTRQKEPRKKHNEENDNRPDVPEYVDDRTLRPWTGKL